MGKGESARSLLLSRIPAALGMVFGGMAFALLIDSGHAEAQDGKALVARQGQGVDPKQVDGAVQRGTEWLLRQPYKYRSATKGTRHEDLALLTLHHGGADPNHPAFQALLKKIVEGEITGTYVASVQAMFLSQFDPTKYQGRIAQCCQFLVDNQNEQGYWHYGEPTPMPQDFPTLSAPKDVTTPGVRVGKGPKDPAASPQVKKPSTIIQIKRQKWGPADKGDNSNSQYAALGLRACMEANVFPPRDALERALKYWESKQAPDGGWSYHGPKDVYGSMSAGGLGALVIYRHYLKLDWQSDPCVTRAIQWIGDNFSVESNPKSQGKNRYLYYYLYAVERAGVLSSRMHFGAHDWYPEGARTLLAAQKPDGSWQGPSDAKDAEHPVVDTCFAILFLRRATRPLIDVASVDRFRPGHKR